MRACAQLEWINSRELFCLHPRLTRAYERQRFNSLGFVVAFRVRKRNCITLCSSQLVLRCCASFTVIKMTSVPRCSGAEFPRVGNRITKMVTFALQTAVLIYETCELFMLGLRRKHKKLRFSSYHNAWTSE